MKNQRWFLVDGDMFDMGELFGVLKFVFVNWETHTVPTVFVGVLNDRLQLMITWDEHADEQGIEYDTERMISFARQCKIKLKRK